MCLSSFVFSLRALKAIESLVGGLEHLGHLQIGLGICVRFLIQVVRLVEVLVNVTLNIRELFRGILGVSLEDHLVLVPTLDKLAEVELLVNVARLLHCELRQSLLEVRMEVTWVNEESLGKDVLTELILGDHTLNGMHEHVFRVALKHVLHRGGL